MDETTKEPDLIVYASGLGYCSVCTCLSDRTEIEQQVNRMDPTGIDSPWTISDEEKFLSGHDNPCVCEKNPNRTHYLLECKGTLSHVASILALSKSEEPTP